MLFAVKSIGRGIFPVRAEEDKRKRAFVDARNEADAMIYSTEKALAEVGEKIDEATTSQVRDAVAELKKAMEGDSIEELNQCRETLTHAAHALSQTAYQQSQPGSGHSGHDTGHPETSSHTDDDVIDADYREVA